MNATNIVKSDFLDILFDGRNKDYGAYDLRRSEDRRVRNAIMGTASIALVIIGGYVLSNKLMAAGMHTRSEVVITPTELKPIDVPEEKPLTPPPPPVTTPPPPATSSIRMTSPPIITHDDLVRLEDEVPKMDSIGNKAIGVANIQSDFEGPENPFAGDGTPGGPIVEPPKAPDRSTIVTYVEVMPSFPGGEDALAKFLQKNIRYPHLAQESDIEGKVFVQFVVNYEGKISEVQTVGAQKGGGLEEEAMRVVKLMPNWKPGRQNGQSVSVRYILPVGFRLEK